jgi:hypothetical protein
MKAKPINCLLKYSTCLKMSFGKQCHKITMLEAKITNIGNFSKTVHKAEIVFKISIGVESVIIFQNVLKVFIDIECYSSS